MQHSAHDPRYLCSCFAASAAGAASESLPLRLRLREFIGTGLDGPKCTSVSAIGGR